MVLMDDQMISQAYEAPRLVDYGDLQDLTAACQNTLGADGTFVGATERGFSNPTNGQCTHPKK
jgi:hypothetical protein